MKHKQPKYIFLIYGEGKRDVKFWYLLTNHNKFKYHTKNWKFKYNHASGGEPTNILQQCSREVYDLSYDLVICIIDTDILRKKHPKNWLAIQQKLEKKYKQLNIKILWQDINAEDEFKKIFNKHNLKQKYQKLGKAQLNAFAQKNIKLFINSTLWKRLLTIIKEKEKNISST